MRSSSRRLNVGLGVIACVAIAAAVAIIAMRRERQRTAQPPQSAHAAPRTYIGAQACAGCHAAEFAAWTGSHHDLAMQPATAATVLGDFNDATFESFGIKTTFFRRDGKFMVRTDGPDGAPGEFQVEYTFGVAPLQQYLVAFPGGRYQALPVAWDSRAEGAKGGQRWFHLYPKEAIAPADALHWTGRYQNWNLMCAECHSTNLRKGYDAASNTYATTFSEINVACEACHGPGSRHAEWARDAEPPYDAGADHGLGVSLESRWSEAWHVSAPETRWPSRDRPAPAAVLNACAACHARRSTIAEGVMPGAPLEDSHRLSMLTAPLYHADGQQDDEVYTWGSFLQSRMAQKGVTCMDCHDPHTLEVRAEGNALCARCHAAAIFDTPKHHFHGDGSLGARCVACHMPSKTYMLVHDRLDHSIRVPRPDLAALTGAPNACTTCHADRKPEWAASAMDRWYTPSWRQRPEWGTVLAAGASQGAKALPSLLALAQDAASPAIVRATAGTLAGDSMRPEFLPAVRAMLADPEPSVRLAALSLLEGFDASTRVAVAGAALSDGVRGVRIDAAKLLADVPREALPQVVASARDRATQEYEEALRLNADWPAETANAGNFALRRGKPDDALRAFQRALELDPRFVGARLNLADTYRQLGREADAERELRSGLALLPESADLHHSLGLLLIRKSESGQGSRELASAASLAPDNARYVYVHAIALQSSGDTRGALDVLRKADAEHPFNPEILSALISILRERNAKGDQAEASMHAGKLAQALPPPRP